jgi:hypothetical protein
MAVFLAFLDRSRYISYSRGSVGPITDSLLRKSGSTGHRIRTSDQNQKIFKECVGHEQRNPVLNNLVLCEDCIINMY